jgi:hypothetical protein
VWAASPASSQRKSRAGRLHDLHATILRLLGLDHEKLTFRHAGRDFRLSDVRGRAASELIA